MPRVEAAENQSNVVFLPGRPGFTWLASRFAQYQVSSASCGPSPWTFPENRNPLIPVLETDQVPAVELNGLPLFLRHIQFGNAK